MENKELDIISIGDSTIDHFVIFNDAHVDCELDKDRCQLCMNYADKLPVEQYVSLVAGNAVNNAVGSSRLGLKAAFYTVLGDDEGGHRIKEKIAMEGVDTSLVEIKPGDETNNSFVLSFQGERTILVYHVHHNYKLPQLPPTKWIYLTSTGKGYENMFRDVLNYAQKNGIKIAYNPGTYQLRGDSALMADIIAAAEVTSINVQEAQTILSSDEKDVKALLRRLHEMGTAVPLITDGTEGAYAFDGNKYYHLKRFTQKTVETTGAGDGFTTGFVAALISGETVPEALRWGSINANSVVQHIGPQEGLLTKKIMHQRLHANPDYQPEEV